MKIDIDCIEEERPLIFKYITERFGERNVARVAAFGTIKAKGVIDDVARHLSKKWILENPTINISENPWALSKVAEIKKEFETDEATVKERYPEIFYYFDGLLNTRVSQSVHPAGMVISPISLSNNYGVFDKEGEPCLMLDMEEAHEVGIAKYDFLVLKTVDVIKQTCTYLNVKYPKTHEVDWEDLDVWASMIKDPFGIFQFERASTFRCLRQFAPKNIFDMSLVTASVRPSGASYRDELMQRKFHKNPSTIIDDLLKDNLGYLVYQEDTIKFLKNICGLSGSQSDTVRRGIGRKKKEVLDAAMPLILEGYCNKSSQPREIAEEEAKEFLKIIEDSSNYQFNYSHSVAYCLLGYLCAYYRHYHPVEFITAYLNKAANDEDIINGTAYAEKHGIKVTMPKWGYSKANYFYNLEDKVISKGLASIKHMGVAVAEELFKLSKSRKFERFTDVLIALKETKVNMRQIDILIKIEFFSAFGNQTELLRIVDLFDGMFKSGDAKQIKRTALAGTQLEDIVARQSVGTTKSGGISKSYTLLDTHQILNDIEDHIKTLQMKDLSDINKIRNFYDLMGYLGYTSNKQEDRSKLYITEVRPLHRKKDKKLFGYSVATKSIGSGIESKFTVFKELYDQAPISKGNILRCLAYKRDSIYFQMTKYEHII